MINLTEMLLRDSEQMTGRAGLVIGSAKSAKVLKRKPIDGIRIGIGDLPWRAPEFGPYDYWVTSNSEYPLIWNKRHFLEVLKSDATTLISTASVGNLKNESQQFFSNLDANAEFSKIVVYDQRHFNGQFCDPIRNCCLFSKMLVHEKTIQELLSDKIGLSFPSYSPGSTVAIQGFALAILLNLNPIYIAGVEIPTDIRDYNYIHNLKMPNESLKSKFKRVVLRKLLLTSRPTDFTDEYLQIMRDFDGLAEIAEKLGITTFCLSKTSSLNKISRIRPFY